MTTRRRKEVGAVGGKLGVVRRFVARTSSHEAWDDGRIDTGADRTVLTKDMACRLDARHHIEGLTTLELPGGDLLVGFEFPVKIRVSHRTASVNAFAPLFVDQEIRDKNGDIVEVRRTVAQQKLNLIGEDFLRQAMAKLDYGKPGMEFSGVGTWRPTGKFKKASPEQERYGRELLKRWCSSRSGTKGRRK